MEAHDHEFVEIAMIEETNNFVKNKIYEVVLRSSVPVQKSILRAGVIDAKKT